MGDNGASHERCAPLEKCPAAPDPTRARLDRVINDVIADHGLQGPAKQSAGDFTRKEFLKLYDHPNVSQLEAVLLKRITEDEARHILFFPDEDQAAYYRTLIADPPPGAPAEHPQRAVQIPHLSLLYLQHWKRWDFVSAFVLSGGLHTLCSLFAHDNPVVRLKAITTLVSITAHREFDWFTPPPRARAAGPGGVVEGNNTTEARLHRALLGLRQDPAFIPGLIANSWGGRSGAGRRDTPTAVTGEEDEEEEEEEEEGGGGSFPGACLMCLELLAMWLSWVRALHTADGTLRLSRPLLRAIEEWGGKKSGPESGRGWDKGQWVPTLPVMQQQQQQRLPAVAEDGAPGKESEPETGSGEADKEPGFTPEMMASDDTGKNEGQRGNVPGAEAAEAAAVAATASGRAPASDLEAEAMMLKAEREERRKVLELVGRLVADFGRFPPAEQEWEEVEDGGRGEATRELAQGAEGGAVVGSGNGGDGREDADSENGGLDKSPSGEEGKPSNVGGGGRGGDRGDSGPVLRPEEARYDGDCASVGRGATAETSPSASARKALALKVEGNESYKQGRLEEATEKYTTALGVLDAAAGAASSEAPSQQRKASANTPGDASEAEAAVLRGVLHRNRAAVALRLFEVKAAAAAAAARDGKATEARHKGSTGGVNGGNYTGDGAGGRQQGSAGSEPALGEGDQALPSNKGEGGPAIATENTRPALESSLALLEECESDCLKAIEMDAGDKKARLRLDRCRDLRRRCYRGGLAAVAAGRDGSSTNYSRQDERLQGRKADLVAKILARTEGSHEIVGGAGAGKASGTAAAPVSTATGKADDGAMPSDSRGDGASAEEKALAGGTEERGTDAGIGGGRALGGKKTLAADRISARDSGLAGQGDSTDHAPREGSELRGALNPSSNTAARTTHGKKAKNPAAPKNKNGGEKGGAARPRRPSKTADAAAARRIRRRLEQAAARAAAVSLPTAAEQGSQGREKAGERQKGWEEAAKEVWDVLSSLPSGGGGGDGSIGGLSLDKLFGDGITAESLVGVARGLRYACGTDVPRSSAEEAQGRGGGALSNTDRASQLFLELATVKRVGLASAMCSPKDRLVLTDVSDGVRRHLVGASGGGPGGVVGGETGEDGEQGAGGVRRLLALEAAISALGL